MIDLIIAGAIAVVLAIPFVAIYWHFRYKSQRMYFRNIIDEEGRRRMRLEQWYTGIDPVMIVKYEDDPPPGNRPRRWPDA